MFSFEWKKEDDGDQGGAEDANAKFAGSEKEGRVWKGEAENRMNIGNKQGGDG